MDKETIIEGNKLIADSPFSDMRADYILFNGKQTPVGYTSEILLSSEGNVSHHFPVNMQYDSNYNWLMPVVEKIEKQGCIVEISYALICNCRICVIGKKGEKAFNIINDNNGGEPSIYAIYKSVVQYVQFYNSLTPKQ